MAKSWFAYAASGDWQMSGGRRIRNWRASLYWFDQKHTDILKFKVESLKLKEVAPNGDSLKLKGREGVSPEVLALEEQMREQRRREREQADREADTPEAKAAAEAFFDKFCKK